MVKFNIHNVLAEVAAAKSPGDKEFKALHPVDKKQFVDYPEGQFKGTTKKDESKEAHPSNATGVEDEVEKEKPVSEEKLDEARFDHRTAATHGVIHPDYAKNMKVGEHADFYDTKNGDKKYGKVTRNDGKNISVSHERKTHKFKVGTNYPGLNESFESLVEENLQEISKKVLGSYIKKAGVSLTINAHNQGRAVAKDDLENVEKAGKKISKRYAGIRTAADKLTK